MTVIKWTTLLALGLIAVLAALELTRDEGISVPFVADGDAPVSVHDSIESIRASSQPSINAQAYSQPNPVMASRPSRTGIVGLVESSRCLGPEGRRGVRVGACSVRADAVSQSATTTTFEVGLGGEVRADALGYFELPLAEGEWRIVVTHFPAPAAEPYLLEIWNTRVTLSSGESCLRDLGVIRLPESVVRGSVRRTDGNIIRTPLGSSDGVRVSFSDKPLDAKLGIVGCDVSLFADPEGRFAIGFARGDGGWVKGTLRASYGGANVEQRDVMMGDTCHLALDTDAIPSRAVPPQRIVVDGSDGTLIVWHDDTERPLIVDVAQLPQVDGIHRVFTTRRPAGSTLSYEFRRRGEDGVWRVSAGSFVARGDGVPHHVDAADLRGREIVGFVGTGVVRRIVPRARGGMVIVDEVPAGPDGRFRMTAVPASACTLLTSRGSLQISASDASTTDVGVIAALLGEMR